MTICIEELNLIYDHTGFDGILKVLLSQLEYGQITQTQPDLYRVTTGGWSEDEDLLENIVHMASIFGNKHYVGYIRGGAYYFTRNPEKTYEIKEEL